jgi:hypothetical protein
VLLLLDHLGLPDGGDDSTSVRVTIIEGSATIAVLDTVLSGGRLPIAIKADRPGDVVLEIRGSGIPVSTISLRARSGVRLDLDPTRGDQAARRVTRQVGQELTVDLYSDADPTPAMGVHYRVAYDSDALAFIRIDPTPSLLEAESLVFYENGVVDVSTVFLEGEFELGDGWIGRLVFRLVAEVASAAVTIEEASIGYADRRIESYLIGADGAGSVMVEAKLSFLRLAEVFGLDESDPGFDPRYDLNGDGQISYSDFLDFAARQSP